MKKILLVALAWMSTQAVALFGQQIINGNISVNVNASAINGIQFINQVSPTGGQLIFGIQENINGVVTTDVNGTGNLLAPTGFGSTFKGNVGSQGLSLNSMNWGPTKAITTFNNNVYIDNVEISNPHFVSNDGNTVNINTLTLNNPTSAQLFSGNTQIDTLNINVGSNGDIVSIQSKGAINQVNITGPSNTFNVLNIASPGVSGFLVSIDSINVNGSLYSVNFIKNINFPTNAPLNLISQNQQGTQYLVNDNNTTTFEGNVNVGIPPLNLIFNGPGTVIADKGVTLNAAVVFNASGTLSLGKESTLTGPSVVFNQSGTISGGSNQTLNTSVVAASPNLGVLALNGTTMINGDVGSAPNPIKTISQRKGNSITSISGSLSAFNLRLANTKRNSSSPINIFGTLILPHNPAIGGATFHLPILRNGIPSIKAHLVNFEGPKHVHKFKLDLSNVSHAPRNLSQTAILKSDSMLPPDPEIEVELKNLPEGLKPSNFSLLFDNNNIFLTVSDVKHADNVRPVEKTLDLLIPVANAHPNSDLAFVESQLASLTLTDDFEEILLQIDPVSGLIGVGRESFVTTKQFLKVWLEHLQRRRTLCLFQNREDWCNRCQDCEEGLRVWADGFGYYGHQEHCNNFNDYNVHTWGTTLAAEIPLPFCGLRAGIGAGYANTDLRSGRFGNSTKINNYQGTLYFSYDLLPWFLDGGFSFGWNDYKGARHIKFKDIHRTAHANYNGQEYTGFLTSGYRYYCNNFEITPLASVIYSSLHINSYKEKEAISLNLHIKDQNYQFLESEVGLKLAYLYDTCYGSFIPEVHSLWIHNFNDNFVKIHARFSGLGEKRGKFKNRGSRIDRDLWNIGGSITCIGMEHFSILAGYDYERGSTYDDHQGMIELVYDF